MNLLMITRNVDLNDARAGHTYAWVLALARALALRHGRLLVLCLAHGDLTGLPENVEVFSLGKERGVSRVGRWARFPLAAWRLVGQSQAVFCHQNPEYALAVWPIAAVRRRRLVAWYTHGRVTWKTRTVAWASDVVLTASPESFRVHSPKVLVTGHGIDVQQFAPQPRPPDGLLHVVSVGRISPTKDYATLIKAMQLLQQAGRLPVDCVIVGGPGLPGQTQYFAALQAMVEGLGLNDLVRFAGAVPHVRVAAHYQQADVMVNLSGTGSLDKAVLEAMACGCIVISSNAAFRSLLPTGLFIPGNNPSALAEALARVAGWPVKQRRALGARLRATVVRDHSLLALAAKIVAVCARP